MFNFNFNNCVDYLREIYIDIYTDKKYRRKLKKIIYSIPIIEICAATDIDVYSKIIVCDQHAVIFSHYLDLMPVMATYALNACIGVILYLPQFKVGCIAHMDGLPGYSKRSAMLDGVDIAMDPVTENLRMIFDKLHDIIGVDKIRTSDVIIIDLYLVGGVYTLSEVMIIDILETIDIFCKINPKFKFVFRGRNLLGPGNQSRNICFDTATGVISKFDYIINSTFYRNHVRDNLPMNIIRAPRISEALLDITYEPVIAYV